MSQKGCAVNNALECFAGDNTYAVRICESLTGPKASLCPGLDHSFWMGKMKYGRCYSVVIPVTSVVSATKVACSSNKRMSAVRVSGVVEYMNEIRLICFAYRRVKAGGLCPYEVRVDGQSVNVSCALRASPLVVNGGPFTKQAPSVDDIDVIGTASLRSVVGDVEMIGNCAAFINGRLHQTRGSAFSGVFGVPQKGFFSTGGEVSFEIFIEIGDDAVASSDEVEIFFGSGIYVPGDERGYSKLKRLGLEMIYS
jgi:hypothetical protein